MMKVPFLLIALFAASSCFAGDTDTAIHTYGGGPLLEKVFNAIALILYGDAQSGIGKAFNGILRLSMAVGGFCCACLAFFREKFDPLFKTFFLPAVGIVCCLLVPRTSVLIVDHIGQKTPSAVVWGTKKVDNVPFFLGKFATLVSEVSYRLERLFTDRVHDPNDKMYDWTGNIYAGENIFRARKCRISNPTLEDGFREFCRECVFRDIGIGLYTKDQLIKTPNILKFLEENTSNMRTMFYKDPLSQGAPQSECLTCREAMKKMNQLLNGKEGNAKELLLGEIGNQIHFLLGQKQLGERDLQNLMKQQIAIDILKEEIPGSLNSFAAKRAEILQKENQKILGALGVSSLVAMRNFFEATIYMVFPVVLIVALLSFGMQAIIQWMQFVLWVNTWPLFYIVVNFLLNSIWDARKKTIFGEGQSLTIFSSEGLSDLYSSMESIAAIALAFIPYLSWILLKGGVNQMVHMASSIMSPAQSAASTAAAERTSGNYSFGNISLDSTSGYNAQMFRQTYSGMLSQGSVGIDSGAQTLTYAPGQDELYLKQSDSYLREGISRTEAFSSSLQDSLSSSQTALHESSNAVSESLTNSANKGVGFVDAISRHFQKGENFNSQEMSSTQESFQYIKNVADEYAESRGVGKDMAFRELLTGGLGVSGAFKMAGFKGDAQVSAQDGVSRHSSDTQSERASESSGFQHHLQTIRNLSSGEVASVLGSEDTKLHQDFVQSLNETDSSVDQWRAAFSRQESLSNLQSFAESENLSVHQNLNQRFVEFLREKYQGDVGQVIDATELNNLDPQKRMLIDEFVSDYLPSRTPFEDLVPSQEVNRPDGVSKKSFEEGKMALMDQMGQKIGHDFGELGAEISHTASRIASGKDETRQDVTQGLEETVSDRYESNRTNVKAEIGKTLSPLQLAAPQFVKSTGIFLWKALFAPKDQELTGNKNE
jgi:conjugal transfer mating pair stabilization protein TraG